ncbi:hypothetical protein BUALT_Bualt11G0040200 [Buddleja alternifolia]|uniref:Homeobox domain-containing protein n=1 Tax=Buddleja alternifolia TaxID=168488 RepID=A0AAV6X362_9LAMI|nr:hypothetical protein BUALT_Bualt11G0040200 [Buddleja alternifolia]
MEWEKQQAEAEVNGIFVKVMTEEQMEVLRKQIAVYATICEQLLHFHKSQNHLPGVRLGNPYYDPLITSGGHKISGRQRWTPTPMQLQILERIFNQEIGNPQKPKVQEITAELLQHGQISETNVYNWFQNRRARSKRKPQAAAANNADSEVETEVELPNEKSKPEDRNPCFQNTQASSGICSVDPCTSKPESMLSPEGNAKIGGGFGQVPYYGSMLPNPIM